MKGRVLSVDPGEKRIGLAISDSSGVIANPLTVIQHVSRAVDAAAIAQIASENDACLIVIGQVVEMDGSIGPQGRKAQRMLEALRQQTDLPLELWDEGGSTQAARSARIGMGVKRSQRSGHLDDLAATYLLQDFLDNHPSS